MTYLARIYIPALLSLLLGIPIVAQQQPSARADAWRGLTVDVSTPEDAIRNLGKPSGDKDKQSLHILMVDRWLTSGKHNQKIFRRLTFMKPAGFAEARLSFLNDKL